MRRAVPLFLFERAGLEEAEEDLVAAAPCGAVGLKKTGGGGARPGERLAPG